MARILVISDIHYSKTKCNDVYDSEHINENLPKILSENIYDILLSAIENEKEPIDLIIFCGDYVIGSDTKDNKKESFKDFKGFLQRIEDSDLIFTHIKKEERKKRIIIVPGNHDIDRDSEQIFNIFKKTFKDYRTPFSKKDFHNNAPTYIYDDLKLIIDCEETENSSATKNNKIQEVLEIINTSSISQQKKDRIKTLLNKDTIIDVPSVSAKTRTAFKQRSSKIKDNNSYSKYLKVLVTHHPLVSGFENGITIKGYNTTIAGYDFMRSAMEFGYQLFIHGHFHQKSCIELNDYGNDVPQKAIQLGIPQLSLNDNNGGITIIDTSDAIKTEWPCTIIFKSLCSLSNSFNQVSVLKGNKQIPFYNNQEMKILVDREISMLIDEGKIIKNGDRDRVEAASYDCAMGYYYKRSDKSNCNWDKLEKIRLTSSENSVANISIQPKESVLIYTYEVFDVPKNIIMHASPISSLARKGLRIEISNFVDPGFQGPFCFPVINESNETIYISAREAILSIEIMILPEDCEKGWAERHEDKLKEREVKGE